MKRKFTILRFCVVICLLVLPQIVNAQFGTMYYMTGIPQSYFLNPATQPQCQLFIGVPGGSSQYISVKNAFDFNDILYTSQDDDSLITPLYSSAEMEKFLAKFDKTNSLGQSFDMDLISFGFRVKEMFFTFDFSNRQSLEFTYPKDLLSFLINGNQEGQQFDFSGLGFDAKDYLEMGFGISRKFNDMFYVGVRPKLLFGVANLSSTNNKFTLATGVDSWDADISSEVNISALGVSFPENVDGLNDFIDGIDADVSFNSVSDIRKTVFANKGLGIDLGTHVYITPRLELSASVIDIGFINWKKNTGTIKIEYAGSFSGFNVSPGDTNSLTDRFLDSLKSNANFTSYNNTTFQTNLTPKVFLGGRFYLMPGFDVGFVSRMKFGNGSKLQPDLTLLANWRPSTVLGVSASYGLLSNNYSNFGLGFHFRLGPVALYIVSDVNPATYSTVKDVSIIIPNNFNQVSLRFGANMVFGANHVKKLLKDKPMYYTDEY